MSDLADDPARAASERARRRRLLARRRAQARRRRTALGLLAAVALLAGIALGAGGGGAEETPAGEVAEVPTVEGFSGPVPILMYHGISDPPPGAEHPALFVPAEELEAQVRWLARRGYNAVTLAQLIAAWRDGEPIAANPVVLSFDDGLRSQYVNALPILAEQGWPGVLGLKLESLTQGEMGDEMVAEMLAAGWELCSHTVRHLDLTTLEAEALREEVIGSGRQLRRRFDSEVGCFVYPAGRYDDDVLAAVRRGYAAALTTEPGLAAPDQDPYELARVRVDGGDGVPGLRAKLSAAGGR